MSDESPTYKQCTKCRETKLLDAFRVAAGKFGHRGQCKECEAINRAENYYKRRSYFADYYVANKKRIREVQRSYERINYPTISKAKRPYRLAYYISNLERIREQHRTYRAADPDRERQRSRDYQAANRDKRLEYERAYRKTNPDVGRGISQRRRARKKGNGGTFTTAELKAMRIEYAGVCAYCKGQHDPDELTIDHVIPLDQDGRHEAANIVLACGICNSSKGNRTPDQWTDRWYERKNRKKK